MTSQRHMTPVPPPDDDDAPYRAEDVVSMPARIELPKTPSYHCATLVRDIWDAEKFGYSRVRYWRGEWFTYAHGVYTPVPADWVKARLYEFANSAVSRKDGEFIPWGAEPKRVNPLLDALTSACRLPHTLEIGQSIDGTEHGPVINLRTGLLDLDTRELHPHTPGLFTTTQLPVDYDADAGQPTRWLKFLGQVFDEDRESIEALQQWFGYVLSGRTHLQKALFLKGQKRSGKGTIANVLTDLVGGDANVAAPTAGQFITNFGLQNLIGKTLAVIGDLRARSGGQEELVERLLTIIGEDALTIDRKYREPWTGKVGARMMFLSNDPPSMVDASGALASRFLFLETKGSWLGKEDLNLAGDLRAEMDAILQWALDGYDHIRDGGRITEPAASSTLRGEADTMGSSEASFIEECCVLDGDLEDDLGMLHAVYLGWRQVQHHHGGKALKKFAADLRGHIPHQPASRKSNSRSVQPGVRVRDDLPADVRYLARESLNLRSPLYSDPRISSAHSGAWDTGV